MQFLIWMSVNVLSVSSFIYVMLHVLYTSFRVDVSNVCLVSKKRYSIYLLPFVLLEFNIVAVPFPGCDHLPFE